MPIRVWTQLSNLSQGPLPQGLMLPASGSSRLIHSMSDIAPSRVSLCFMSFLQLTGAAGIAKCILYQVSQCVLTVFPLLGPLQVTNYLHASSKSKLLHQVETEVLIVHQSSLLEKENSGCSALLQDDKVRSWPLVASSTLCCCFDSRQTCPHFSWSQS